MLSLTELIATFGDPDTEMGVGGALQVITEVVGVDFAAVCGARSVVEAVGFDQLIRPDRELLALARSELMEADVSGVGPVSVARSPVTGTEASIVMLRATGPFTDRELGLVNTIGRIAGLAATMRSALEAERSTRVDLERRVDDNRVLVAQLRERQGLLDRLFRIQQSILRRSPTQAVLDSVTEGALDLLDVDQVRLRIIPMEQPGTLLLASSQGFDPEQEDAMRASCVVEGPIARAINENRLVADHREAEGAAMAAPVAVGAEVVGCLSVSTVNAARRFSPAEQEALIAFAQHASLALQDARSADAMRNALDRERHRAEHDPLTGLPNRPTIRAALSHRIGIADKVPIVLLFVDLDRFKLTNDTLGHSFGDTVLTVVSDRLKTSVRAGDVVGRLSGDEFVVICEGITEVGAVEVSERLQAVISEPISEGHIEHVITASVGIARAHRGESAQQVLANADLAMYRAKEAGRGGVEVFDDALRDQVEERMIVSQDLRRALEQNELRVHLQPVVGLPSRLVVGFEALVRWQHPIRGLLAPSAFLSLAEDTGQSSRIDIFVLEETIKLLGSHAGSRPISVNLSARTFSDPALTPWISDRLQEADVEPSRLIIEVTETLLMDSSGAASGQVTAMRDLGLKILIDDFGTGYSSLAYLQTFEVDGVKIDRGFISRLDTDPRAEAIVSAVFSMAAALDLLVVAEGVETDEQMDRVLAIRDKEGIVELYGQGYLFGRAVDGDTRLGGFVELASRALR